MGLIRGLQVQIWAKLTIFATFWIHFIQMEKLIRPIIHQRVMLDGPESPKSPHKIVLPENVSMTAFYTVIMGEMDPK